MSKFFQYIKKIMGGNTSQVEYERVYPRPAQPIIPVSVSRFREEMDAEMTDPRLDPRMAGAFEPQAAPTERGRGGQAIRRLLHHDTPQQQEQPQRQSEKVDMTPVREPKKENKKGRSCTSIPMGTSVSAFFTRLSGRVNQHHAQLPVTPVELDIFLPQQYQGAINKPTPCLLRRSNAVRGSTHRPQVSKPVPCQLHRSNATRCARQDSGVSGGVDWELGYYPGGEADAYYLTEPSPIRPSVQRPTLMLDTNPVLPERYESRGVENVGWEQQRLVSCSPLSTSTTDSFPSDGEIGVRAAFSDLEDVSPGIPAAVPTTTRFSLDVATPEDTMPAAARFSLSDGVPEVISSKRRFSLGSCFSVGSSLHPGGQDIDDTDQASSPGSGPSLSSMSTVDRDEARRRAYMRLTGEVPEQVVDDRKAETHSSPPTYVSLASFVSFIEIPYAESEPIDQSLFHGFSGIWIFDQNFFYQAPAYEDTADINPFSLDCVDRVSSAQVIDASICGNTIATETYQPIPHRPGPQFAAPRPM